MNFPSNRFHPEKHKAELKRLNGAEMAYMADGRALYLGGPCQLPFISSGLLALSGSRSNRDLHLISDFLILLNPYLTVYSTGLPLFLLPLLYILSVNSTP